MTREEIIQLTSDVHNLNKGKENALPDHSYFLDKDRILCYPRKYGDSRYPYYNDGLVLFAHTSGYIDCVDGRFTIFRCQEYNEDAPVAFFAGEKTNDGFFPISVTGAARQLFEGDDITRYTVFTPLCAYYITETKKATFVLRVYVDQNKHIRFSVGAVNKAEKREIYLASFFEPLLRYFETENFFHRMSKYGKHFENGSFLMQSANNPGKMRDSMAMNVATTGNVTSRHFTTAKKTFLGRKGGNLTNAIATKNGCFDEEIPCTNTTDIPCASEFVHFDLDEGGFACIDYDILITDDENKAMDFIEKGNKNSDSDDFVSFCATQQQPDFFQITFDDWHNEKLHPAVINNFLSCVTKQINLCALGKNYAGDMLGIRDVFQQLETSLIWKPEASRKQIVRVMNYILDTGRAPRQISFPTKDAPIPAMDLRPFIDQGFWIIATLNTYLAFTDDKSILDEICGYYACDETFGPLRLSETKDSLLDHLIKILEYLISNIDEETYCVRALWGDWNDALDALGKTKDKDKEFGNGVSVMATEQLYLALNQMCEILAYAGNHDALIARYQKVSDKLAEGFRKHAVAEKGEEARVVHGWGDKRAYYIGSFCDYDKKARMSLTANAFFAISGLNRKFPELQDTISKNILSLDSKYGLITFDEPFYQYAEEVGRLSGITIGTYENACAYVHASTFGVMALFMMGHGKEAWEQLEKSMVISQENATRTTFVMPNSYCYTEEYSADGDSMGDWYTGSGTVLIKNIVKCGFGIVPTLDGVRIAPPSYMPSKSASIHLLLKGKKVTVLYENKDSGERSISIDDKTLPLAPDGSAFIKSETLKDESIIKITA